MQECLQDILWPPVYKIKKHRRARNVKISTSKKFGLEITVPYRFSLKNIPSILEENKDWVIKQLILHQSRQSDVLPDIIAINAINEIWKVTYQETIGKIQIIERPNNEMVLVGKIQDKTLCREKLTQWLKDKAKNHLVSILENTSNKIQLPYIKSIIRDQSTRWGSCTSGKTISLNFKLLFLPLNLVTHIVIHELCHTVVLNHSDQFWNLVSRFDPMWKEHKRAMKKAEQFVPDWL